MGQLRLGWVRVSYDQVLGLKVTQDKSTLINPLFGYGTSARYLNYGPFNCKTRLTQLKLR